MAKFMIELKFGKRRVINYRGARKVVGGLTAKNKIDILMYVAKELSLITDINTLLERTVSLCVEIFEVDNVTIRMLEDGMLVPLKFLKETNPPRRALEPGEGFSGSVYREGQSVIFEDLSRRPDLVDEGESTLCTICVPVRSAEAVFGTIAIEKDTAYFYHEGDLEILDAMAAQLGLAISNSRLIQAMNEARRIQDRFQKQIEWDLRMGRDVQEQIIPAQILPWNGFTFRAHYEPMVEVSGDYIGIVRKPDSITIFLADVAGHGVPAALITMSLHYHFNRCAGMGMGLIETLEELSERLRPTLPEGVYFTAQLLRINHNMTANFVNAGHQPLVIFHGSENETEFYDTPGIPIGFTEFQRDRYQEISFRINPGDLLIVCSDGITEQRNVAGEETGIRRFLDWVTTEKKYLTEFGDWDLDNLYNNVIRRFRTFAADAPIGDDITMMMISANPDTLEARALYATAIAAYKSGDLATAYRVALDAYARDRTHRDTLLLLTKICSERETWNSAAKYLEEYIEMSGESSAQPYYLLGSYYYHCGDISKSKSALKKSLAFNHQLSRAQLLLARCYLREKRPDKAMSVLDRALKSTSNPAMIKEAITKVRRVMNSHNLEKLRESGDTGNKEGGSL